jgi:AraC-like DNA-binding protein
MKLPSNYRRGKSLQTLVENRTTYTLKVAEMNLFETHTQAKQVHLRFDQPVLATMLKGKKVMHLEDKEAFAFLPGESLLLPARDLMCIDFPEATRESPTKCLALAIDPDLMSRVANLMNEDAPKADNGQWFFSEEGFQFFNDLAIYQIIQRLIFLIVEDHASKDLFVDMMLKELLIRALRVESRNQLVQHARQEQDNNRIAHVIHHIRKNIREKLTIKELSSKAYMSESNFYKVFKNEMGCSPVDFINDERIRIASSLLQDPHSQVNQVSIECGFNSLSYFNRVFKKKHQLSPKAYQEQMAKA